MTKHLGLKQMSIESKLPEYTLRTWCKQKKIRFLMAGNKYILRTDWLEEDLERMALENINPSDDVVQMGKLRRIEA